MKKLVVAMTLAAFAMPFAKVKPVADSTAQKGAAKGAKKAKKVKKGAKKVAAVKKDSAAPAAPAAK